MKNIKSLRKAKKVINGTLLSNKNKIRLWVYYCMLYLIGLDSAMAQQLKSPCPQIFTYRLEEASNLIFGYIKIYNLQVGQPARLDVALSIGTRLPTKYVGVITLIKSRKSTFNDIIRGLPAQYRVNFPLQNILPTVVSIAINGRTICAGYRANGRTVTTINLKHTLYTEVSNQNYQSQRTYQPRPKPRPRIIVRPQPRPRQPQYQTKARVQPRPQPRPQPQLAVRRSQPVTRPQVQNYQQTRRPQVTQRWATQYVTTPKITPAYRPAPSRTTVAPRIDNFKCGKPSSAYLNKLSINGDLVEKGQFPWIAPLFDRSIPRSPQYFCGSTIITKNHLVTAAHCVYEDDEFMRPERILAAPGMYNIDNFLDEHAKLALISAVIANEEYDHDDDLNDADLAVLRLKTSLVYTDFIIPICPWQGDNNLLKIVDREGFVAGWGLTGTGSTSVPTYIRTFVVDNRQCRANLARPFRSNSRVFCADGKGSAPCNGDSGSGLVIKNGNQYYLRGVVSKGRVDPETLKCDTRKYAIYTDIALFRFWLKAATSK